jgi:dihydrofolate reductase
MGLVRAEITTSLDGFVAGPDASMEHPLGVGGERLHEWAVRLESWREQHGQHGGEDNPDSELLRASVEATGAYVMGRRMYSGGAGPWEEDPNADGWWGEATPFDVPVFVLTHHPRETVVKDDGSTFAFVTEGIEAALVQAREVGGEKDVTIAGGASVIQQALRAGLVDELQLHVAPVILGAGVRLFEGAGEGPIELEAIHVIESPLVTHLGYRPKSQARARPAEA